MKPINLYIKIHNKTQKKYFGQTTKDPFKYPGSGIAWQKHLSENGNDVTTILVGNFEDREQCKAIARKFSIENDIVASSEWLNLIPETLGGGMLDGKKVRNTLYEKYGKDYYSKIAEQRKTNSQCDSVRNLISQSLIAYFKEHPSPNLGKVKRKVVCPNCNKSVAINTSRRWHFENCKKKNLEDSHNGIGAVC